MAGEDIDLFYVREAADLAHQGKSNRRVVNRRDPQVSRLLRVLELLERCHNVEQFRAQAHLLQIAGERRTRSALDCGKEADIASMSESNHRPASARASFPANFSG